jgi:hypothetical protein
VVVLRPIQLLNLEINILLQVFAGKTRAVTCSTYNR